MSMLIEQISVQNNLDKIWAINTANMEIDTIIKLRDSLDSNLTKALNIMQNLTRRIIITGMGKSGHIGKSLQHH